MKKLLTVLLVIAVICTFSFGSAFAKTDFVTSSTHEAMQAGDYYTSGLLPGFVGTRGTVGITDYEKADAIDKYEENLAVLGEYYTYNGNDYTGADYTVVEDALKAALEATKNVKTSYQLNNAVVNTLNNAVIDAKTTAKKHETLVSSTNYNWVVDGNVKTLTTVEINKLEVGTYLLPGYAYYHTDNTGKLSIVVGYVASTTSCPTLTTRANEALNWMLDNDFATKAKIDGPAAKLALDAALVKVSSSTATDTTVYSTLDTAKTDASMVAKYYEAAALVKAFDDAKVTDLDAVDAAEAALEEFEDTYLDVTDGFESYAYATPVERETKLKAAHSYYEAQNFAATYKEIAKLTTNAQYVANKDMIVGLADAIHAYEVKYWTVPGLLGTSAYDLTAQLNAIEAAGDDVLDAGKLFMNTVSPESITVADKAEFEAAVAAYEAYKAEFDKSYFTSECSDAYEAYILACKANLAYLEGKVDKNEVDAQQYLNNATVKVTTVKEGKKVTVNAKVDATSLYNILHTSGVATVEYKFYHKAPGKAYKFTKTKTVNTITYSKSLKAGKNSFRVGVVLKDAKGNVVAEKSYKASTLGYRTIK